MLDLARTTWLEGDQCYDLLVAGEATGLPILPKPQRKPPAGSVWLLQRRGRFRDDGYTWQSKPNGQVREGHVRLCARGVRQMHCYYGVPAADGPHRRLIWIDPDACPRVKTDPKA
ncbi:hypothetical protein FNF27_05731 [Cafeteria roenbergensis]|uniref:CG-1 domain-containing protein n=1 Tax=Cafeteria roenbergensis TaxID=33653 RepID=A0A5A8C765_CAFRO|nr:hypothetical protein FNF31_07531 [Cafeteria roenbergensis]KAA0148527.1 hypothetical protein FNF29_06585 [Cafeteria roenbergensis]KAA0172751.1 hypothetical protein FNF27_05731 [Cafeteria roenbergensis]|eukprot:KAA0148527.1 hypothetical protein FNF29_06585 [Cafeteria roenbergensis]